MHAQFEMYRIVFAGSLTVAPGGGDADLTSHEAFTHVFRTFSCKWQRQGCKLTCNVQVSCEDTCVE
jgi:hypothetical protein